MPNEVTRLLSDFDAADAKASEKLLNLLYDELRKLAAAKIAKEQAGHTLQATALVHEAWIRITGPNHESDWNSRGHFFGAAAEAMRRILVESARRKRRLRHGGGLKREGDVELQFVASVVDEKLLRVHDALDSLAQADSEAAQIVKLRYFVGLKNDETAEVLGISLRTVERRWTWAKAWLYDWICKNE